MATSTIQLLNYAWVLAVFLLPYIIHFKSRRVNMATIGPSGFLTSTLGGIRWLFSASAMLEEGYKKFKGRAFRVAHFYNWHVIVTGEKLTLELLRAPDDKLSMFEGANELLQMDYSFGPNIGRHDYHLPIIRSVLSRNLSVLFPDICDEIVESFKELIPPTDDWIHRPAFPTIMKVVSRTSSRIFVGQPLCRDADYLELTLDYTTDAVKALMIMNIIPPFLRPLVGAFVCTVPRNMQRAMKHLRPLIEERQAKYDEFGSDYPDKPNDLLTWLMEEAIGEERTVYGLANRIMSINFAAIHTSSTGFTQVLYHLASMPEYVAPLREEVDNVLAEGGWNKAALSKMRKVDSFVKESVRLNGLMMVLMPRKALQDFTFSDGTTVPKGTLVSASIDSMHFDVDMHKNATTFDGFRFYNMRQEEGEGMKHQMVSTSLSYLPFGHGRHACPGRFFAANELKAMLAYVLATYDIKLAKDGLRPGDQYLASSRLPDPKAEVLFRKRRLRQSS